MVNIINYFYHLMMGRILGPSEYGVLASLYSILYITSIVPVSTSVSIVKFISGARDARERGAIYVAVKRMTGKVALGLALVIAITSPAISQFLNIPTFWEVALVAPVVFFSLITLVNQSTLQGVLKFTGVVAPNFVAFVAKLIFGIGLVYLGYSVLGAMWGVVIGAILAYLLSIVQIRGVVEVRKENFDLKPFFKYSLPVLLQALAFTSFFTTDLILVKHFFSPFDAGLYAALSTLGKIIFFASSPITSVMFPIVAGRVARGERYFRIFALSILLTGAIAGAIAVLYFLLPNYAIGILYGQEYLAASPLLVWMGVFISLYVLAYLLTNFFLSIGKTWVSYLAVAAAAIQIVAIWLYHANLLIVIQISLSVVAALLLILLAILGYNQRYAKESR